MSKTLNIGPLSMPITQYASQGNAILGIRDSGKTYSATYMGEQLYAAGIPFVAFDPSGVWKFLRVPGKGAGLPVVVAGGKVPDLPLTPQSAPEIVRAAMRANVSLVLDLYDINMSKADWSRIVEACVRVLLYENGEHGLRHIFIEEAAEFAPQQIAPDKAKVYAEVEKLARIGGNALLGYTLINQRAEQVNKAVLELCDCLFLHRQKGKNSIKSLEKWLELSTGGDVKEIIRGLPKMASGEAWVWPANADHAVHVKMPQKQSFHPDRRALIANPAAANVQRIDASAFVTELRSSLEKYVEEAKANDPAELRKRINKLESELAQAALKVDRGAMEFAKQQGYGDGFVDGKRQGLAAAGLVLLNATKEVAGILQSAANELDRQSASGAPPENPQRSGSAAPPGGSSIGEPNRTSAVRARSQRQIDGGAPAGDLSAAARKILAVLAQHREGCESGKLALLTGYSYSGGFRNALSELRAAGLMEGSNSSTMRITAAGLDRGPFPRLPTGPALVAHWLQHPSFSKCARDVLKTLIHHKRGLTAEQLCRATGYEYSGGFRNALSELRTAGVIIGSNRDVMRASEDLF